MAKSKETKRKEALTRQREYLFRVAIPAWCRAGDYDQETRNLLNERLISSAYAARCDRHGNWLDYRFYKSAFSSGKITVSYNDYVHNALYCEVLTLEEMKQQTGGADGRTLYEAAFGI